MLGLGGNFILIKVVFAEPNWLTALLPELAVVLAYGNIYFAELFFFSDVALMYTFTIFFMTLAQVSFFWSRKAAGTTLSFMCMYVSSVSIRHRWGSL